MTSREATLSVEHEEEEEIITPHPPEEKEQPLTLRQQQEIKPQEKAPPGSKHIYFGPRALSDFVVQYQEYSYHVHKAVLLHHSAYFNGYFQGQTTSTLIDFSSIFAEEQFHGGFMLLFLHLYDPDKYQMPPFIANNVGIVLNDRGQFSFSDECYEVKADSDLPSILRAYLPSANRNKFDLALRRMIKTSEEKLVTVPMIADDLVYLAKFLGCTAVLSHCEGVTVDYIQKQPPNKTDAWLYVKYAQDYHWTALKQLCWNILTKDKRVKNDPAQQRLAAVLAKKRESSEEQKEAPVVTVTSSSRIGK